jgi:putative ABC transport system permease protein
MIALFILILAGINFVNLSTARAVRRAKEVGVRKVLGAERRRLVVQFLGESVLLCVLSLTVAVGLIYLILPLFNQLITPSLSFLPFQSGFILTALLGMAVLVGLLAGLYPAFVLARYGPRDALKPASSPKRGRRLFRNVLVTFQYVISIALVCCTLIIQSQLQYVKNYDAGFKKEQVVDIPLLYQFADKRGVFKDEVARLTGVESASLCASPPGRVDQENLFRFEGSAENDRLVLPTVDTDGDYLKTLGLSLAAGRDFSKDLATDAKAVILNETLVRDLGWDNPLGKTVKMIEGDPDRQFIEVSYTVIGVVRDYNFESLHAPIRGLVILNLNRSIESLLVKLRTGNLPATLKEIESVAKTIEPNRPFRAVFLSESFDQMYRSEERMGKIFVSFALLALFVAGLGLFGLAAYTAESRTKEVGIRKTLGASVPSVILLLTKEFVRWVLLANVIAWPIAFFSMNKWLQNFAYRAGFNPFLFLAAGALALVLAVAAVGLKTAGAAAANPVRSLRYE